MTDRMARDGPQDAELHHPHRPGRAGPPRQTAADVRAAIRNGLTPEEIGEVFLQSAVYCGVPAANSAYAVARRVLSECEKEE